MNKKEKIQIVLEELKRLYPQGECALNWQGDPFKLFVLAVLSAQCTDERVNYVSKRLFEVLPNAKAFAESEEGVLEELIHSVGLYNSKSKNLRAASKIIHTKFNDSIPSDMSDLLSLPGVGRKVANLLRGDIYSLGGIVADTHCIRVSGRLGFTDKTTPIETERVLSKILPLDEQSAFCHRIVLFGRQICTARSPKCSKCPMINLCLYYTSEEENLI